MRAVLLCTLLLLAAVPSFAAPVCQECNQFNECETMWSSYERCSYDEFGNCYTVPGRCITPFITPVLADWSVAAIEISRPSDSITITAPAVVTEHPAAPQTAAQK
ncbi:MAG TPA: hypothetical protein VE010_24105 [Thermoanaerobaculia bacterium]|nr:hypothetical protein [Thermoanaerobaculia bacterium]